MKDIGGKVVVVTGASRGLGRAIAQALFDHGMKVVINARGRDELETFQRQLDRSGSRSLAVASDITSAADRAGLLAASREKFGGVDVLVNNAGTDHPEFFADAEFSRVESMVALNVTALMGMTQAVLREMLEGYVRDAGLYHDNSEGSGSVPTVTPTQVGEAVVSAITGDRARVLATPVAMKMTPLLTAIAPGLTYFASKRTGNAGEMRKMADNLKAREAKADAGNGKAPRAGKGTTE